MMVIYGKIILAGGKFILAGGKVGRDSRRRPKEGMGLVMVMVKSKCGGVGFLYPPKREFPLNPSPLSAREPCVNCMLYLSVAIMLVRWSSHM